MASATPPPRSRRPRLLALGLAVVVAGLCQLLFPGWFAGRDATLGDAFWRLGASSAPEQRIVVVDIDEASLAELGPWPWPRERLAALSAALAAQGAALQILDIVLNDPHAGDPQLAATLQNNRAVVAELFAVEQGAPIASGQPGRIGTLPDCAAPWPAAHGYLAPAAAFAGLAAGHITPRVAPDGIVRAQPAYICQGGRAHPALALAAYLDATAGRGEAAAPRLVAGTGWLAPAWQLAAPSLAQPVPLGPAGDLHIPYARTPAAILAVSAADVLAGRLPPQQLKGSWALIGSTAFGLGDIVATPHAGAQGGVGVHLQLLAGLLDERIPYPPQGAGRLQALAAFAALLLLLGLAGWRRQAAYVLPLAGIGLAAAQLAVQAHLQLAHQLLVGMSLPALASVLAGLALGMLEFVRTGGERSRLLAHLASYLPAPVAARLLQSEPQDRISAERRDVTVLFADIRNFSAWCEACDAEHAAGLLHRFLVTATEVVEAHGGLVEAVQGDAVMAVWNGSIPCAEHAACALAAARELRVRAEADWPAPAEADALPPPLGLGIGLESGTALVGSVGPRQRRLHTALGLPVTRAVRLQALTADLAWPILAGPELHQRLPDAPLVSQGEFLLEGLLTPCHVYADAPPR